MVTWGIDWAQDHHDIAIVDAEGRLVAKRRIPESVAGPIRVRRVCSARSRSGFPWRPCR